MADNYLENKFEELRSGVSSAKHFSKDKRSSHRSLNDLLLINRSCRGYDKGRIVTGEELREVIKVNTRIPSAKNQQVLRFKPVTGEEADIITRNCRFGALLSELHLPFPGTEPNAYIIVCSTVPESKWVDIDLGISVQSMLLKAVDLKLNGLCIAAFNKTAIMEAFGLKYEPLLILAIGKSAEKFQLMNIRENESHAYYRSEDIHYVPKVCLEDLVL